MTLDAGITVGTARIARRLGKFWLAASLIGCSSAPQPKPAPSLSHTPAEPSPNLSAAMRDHFIDATAARDAVIAGQLESVKPALQRLATSRTSSDVPVDWQPWLEEMQAEAARGAEATTLAAAADSVAALGTACGECHRATRGGARSPDVVGGYQHGDRTGLEEKMARHRFSADELWRGLTGPAHQAWAQGSAALMNIRMPGLVGLKGTPATTERAPSGQGTLQGTARDPEPDVEQQPVEPAANAIQLDAALRELRELGTQADRARIAADKQRVFAQIIARCGDCHTQAGVKRVVAREMLHATR